MDFLKQKKYIDATTFYSNKIKVVHLPTKSKIDHIGFRFCVGSMSESKEEYGLAHMVEHNIYKGNLITKDPVELNNKFRKIGYIHNANTSYCYTTFFGYGLGEYFEEAFKLFSELVFFPLFPEKEMEKEKNPIINEYEMYKSDPINVFFEKTNEYILGEDYHNIIGNIASIKRQTSETLKNFYQRNYNIGTLTVFISSSKSTKKIKSLIEKIWNQDYIKNCNFISKKYYLTNPFTHTVLSLQNKKNKTIQVTSEMDIVMLITLSRKIFTAKSFILNKIAEGVLHNHYYDVIRDKGGMPAYSLGYISSRSVLNDRDCFYALISKNKTTELINKTYEFIEDIVSKKGNINDDYINNLIISNKTQLIELLENPFFHLLNASYDNYDYYYYNEILKECYKGVKVDEVKETIFNLVNKKFVLVKTK